MPRRAREPEPVEILLVPIDAPGAPAGPGARPSPAGTGSLPPLGPVVSGAVTSTVTRLLRVDDPPLVRGEVASGSWPDQHLHRLIRLPPWDAAVALHEVVRAHHGRIDEPRARRGARDRLRPAGGRLEVEPTPVGGAVRFRGALRMPAGARATPIELVLEPWSAHRSDLCLQPRRGRFGPRLPRRYYDVAHRVMDELWHLIERAAAA